MKPRILVAILTLTVLPALPALSQPAGSDPASERMSQEIVAIRQALDRLVVLLESRQRHQDVDLLLKRIELRERRMEPMERKLRAAENEITGIERQLQNLDQMQEQHEAYREAEIRDGVDSSETRRILDDINRSRQSAEERMQSVRMRAQIVENDLASGRRELEILDEMLEELIESEGR